MVETVLERSPQQRDFLCYPYARAKPGRVVVSRSFGDADSGKLDLSKHYFHSDHPVGRNRWFRLETDSESSLGYLPERLSDIWAKRAGSSLVRPRVECTGHPFIDFGLAEYWHPDDVVSSRIDPYSRRTGGGGPGRRSRGLDNFLEDPISADTANGWYRRSIDLCRKLQCLRADLRHSGCAGRTKFCFRYPGNVFLSDLLWLPATTGGSVHGIRCRRHHAPYHINGRSDLPLWLATASTTNSVLGVKDCKSEFSNLASHRYPHRLVGLFCFRAVPSPADYPQFFQIPPHYLQLALCASGRGDVYPGRLPNPLFYRSLRAILPQ